MKTDLIHGDPECRYKSLTARVAPSVDPDAAIDVACFMSTDTVDADDEVLLPDGVDLARFDKNPVVLLCHASGQPGTYYPLPVGKVEWTKKRPRGVLAGVRFTLRTPMGREVKALFDDDMLRSFSVGFKPIETSPMTGEEANSRPDWRAAFERTRGRILVHRKWHLLELSVAPVPSNPDALVTRYKSTGVAPPDWLELTPTSEAAMSDAAVKGVSVHHRSPVVADTDWDASAAVESVRRWASSDGSGSRDTIAWDRYARAFLWYDETNPDDFPSYKLPVKRAEDGRLVVVEQALRVAAAALEGPHGGEIPDRDLPAVRAVLARYEEDAGIGGPDDAEAVLSKVPEAVDDAPPVVPVPVRVDDHVRIAAPHVAGVGVVKSLHDQGVVPDVPNDILGTADEPAARVQCYKPMGGGYVATDHHLGILTRHLEPIAPLPAPGPAVPKGQVRTRPTPTASPLPPLVPLTDEQVLEGAIARLDRLLRPETMRAMVAAELDRRMGCV